MCAARIALAGKTRWSASARPHGRPNEAEAVHFRPGGGRPDPKLTRLNAASGRGQCRGKAPHKPLLLLCLLDIAEAGELTGRTITRTAGLLLRFKSYGALVSERWPTRLDLRMPLFYLRTQGFSDLLTPRPLVPLSVVS